MAGKPIEIKIDAETTTAERGIGKVADALQDVEDALGKVDDGGSDAKRGLGKVEDQAKDTARVIDRDLTDALKDATRAGKTAGDSIGDDISRGTREASEGLDNMKEEAGGTAREVAASFDGSAESIAGGFQEVAANALGGFGPLGAAAGLAAAAGIGILFNSITTNAEEAKAEMRAMFDDMLASGTNFLSADFLQGAISDIVNGESSIISFTEAQDVAARTGIQLGTVLRAYAGDVAAADEVQQALTDNLDALGDSGGSTTYVFNRFQSQLDASRTSLDGARTKIEAVRDAMKSVPETKTTTLVADTATAQAAIAGIRIPDPRIRPVLDTTELDRELAKPRNIVVGVGVRGTPQAV